MPTINVELQACTWRVKRSLDKQYGSPTMTKDGAIVASAARNTTAGPLLERGVFSVLYSFGFPERR